MFIFGLDQIHIHMVDELRLVTYLINLVKKDCFTLTIPNFSIIGEYNEKLITTDVLEKIKDLIRLNIKLIEDFSDEKISTDEFIDNLKPV